eukprot:CAMPEP_0182417338 /NCGR_PEP_ID=MMETSP1167-20130531/1773_1 /TAXON_ID=2988 /ORGANISM="Mallomonas Sp, Strain CCMP3275" /LENGTH=807 /DNA_ID=CAMNT_0024590799 /DNA_START=148 /DNA_END=2571 /DNA_ORIENTATION=+
MSLFSSLGQGANDIWSITGISFASPVNDILDKENFTIEELLQEDELLQEVKSRNGRLIEFMTQEEVMDKLINYIISSGDKADGDLRIFKYPYMSCEVLCCEIPDILHILVEDCDGKYLKKFFSILDSTETLDHYLAGYFEKTLEMLFRRMTIPVMTYLNKGGVPLLQKFLNHINNYSIMQIVQRLLLPHIPFSIGTVDLESVPAEDRQNCQCNWSFLEETCGLLCEKMLGEGHTDVPSHVSDLLITVLQLSPPDAQFISHLCDAQCLEKLFAAAFAEGAEISELTLNLPSPAANVSLAAISVLESLVSRLCETMNPFDAMGVEMQPEQLQQALNQVRQNIDRVGAALLPSLPQAARQLKQHVRVEGHTLPCGELSSQTGHNFYRLGHRGLQLVKLVEAMLKLGNGEVDSALCEHGLLQACVDLMFQFELHSLLHFAVQRIVVMAMEGGSSRRGCQKVLVSDSGILQRVMDAIATAGIESSGSEPALANCRRPVIGHLIQIAQSVVCAVDNESLEQRSEADLDSEADAGKEGEESVATKATATGESGLQTLIEQHGKPSYAEWEMFAHSTLQRALDIQISTLNAEGASRSPTFLMDSLPKPVLPGANTDIDTEDDDEDDFARFNRVDGDNDGDVEMSSLERSMQSISFEEKVANEFNTADSDNSEFAAFDTFNSQIEEDNGRKDRESVYEEQLSEALFQADFKFAAFDNPEATSQLSTDVSNDFASFDVAASSFESEVMKAGNEFEEGVTDPFFSKESPQVFDELFPEVSTSDEKNTLDPTDTSEMVTASDELTEVKNDSDIPASNVN